MTRDPIHILGAGPGGLGAAISLAQAGREVHVHEKYETVGKRFQGDFQGLENWSTQEDILATLNRFGIDLKGAVHPVNSIWLTSGDGQEIKASGDQPLFYLVKRGPFEDSLDIALYQQALHLGVKFHFRSILPLDKVDILATGPIRKAVVAVDKGIAFKTDLPDIAIGIFHDDQAYLGYSYLLISQGQGCICTVVFRDFQQLNRCFEATKAYVQTLMPLDLTKAKPVGGIGSFAPFLPYMIGKTRVVGEAAGFQDFLWGFGIRIALTSGYLAAQSLLKEEDYVELIESTLKPAFKAGIVNRYMWETFKSNCKPLLPHFLRLPISLRSRFRLLYQYSPLHRMLYPFALRHFKKYYPESISHD